MSRPLSDSNIRRFCAAESSARGEQMAGTATIARCYLLIESNDAWPRQIANLLENLGSLAASSVRKFIDWCPEEVHPLLIRRDPNLNDRRSGRIYVVRAPQVSTGHQREEYGEKCLQVDDYAELTFDQLQDAYCNPDSLQSLLLVCTHGKRDKCCAKFGGIAYRELVERLDTRIQVMQCSHIGGDRFAANALWLPHGLYLGRVHSNLDQVVSAINDERIPLSCLRGNAAMPSTAQYLECLVRQRYGLDRPGGVELLNLDRISDTREHETAEVTLRIDGLGGKCVQAIVQILVDQQGEEILASCNAGAQGWAHPRQFSLLSNTNLSPT